MVFHVVWNVLSRDCITYVYGIFIACMKRSHFGMVIYTCYNLLEHVVSETFIGMKIADMFQKTQQPLTLPSIRHNNSVACLFLWPWPTHKQRDMEEKQKCAQLLLVVKIVPYFISKSCYAHTKIHPKFLITLKLKPTGNNSIRVISAWLVKKCFCWHTFNLRFI